MDILDSSLTAEPTIGTFLPFLAFITILRFYLFIFREEGREGEREGRNIDWLPLIHVLTRDEPTAQACALTRNQTSHLLLCGI